MLYININYNFKSGGESLINEKVFVLAIFFVSLLTISVASAADNVTVNVVGIDDMAEVNTLNNDVVVVDDTTNRDNPNDDVAQTNDLEVDNITNSVTNNPSILRSSESDDEISVNNDESILGSSSPPSNYYSVYVYDATIDWGSSGTIRMALDPCIYDGYYKYDFYLKVGGKSQRYQYDGSSHVTSLSYSIKATTFNPGTYTIQIVNARDSAVMSTATLTITKSSNPSDPSDPSIPHDPTVHTYPSFSVRVSDTSMIYGKSGSIDMSISPATNSILVKYYYYLKVYDSNNVEKISKLYFGDKSSYSYSESYTIGSYKLSPGTYTIKIINYYTSNVMDTAKLTVISYPSYSDYSVKINDTELEYVSGGSIFMSISPASSSTYKYYYYLKVYDSNNNQKISQVYSDTRSAYSKTYSVSQYQLSPGNYTMKIINYNDNKVMSTAKLTIKYIYPSYLDQTVKVSDTSIDYESGGSISMSISPASSSTYKYYYYLKVYDSKNNVKISQLYYNTSSANSKTYNINSTQLNPGTYTIKILDYYNSTRSSAKLTVISYPSYSDYSVNVSTMEIAYGFSGSINMKISPNSFNYYKYYYYLKVYDSNNNEVISQVYSGTSSAFSKTYSISSNQLSVGNYTIKIINYDDGKVMDSANLTVKYTYPSYSDYSVRIYDTSVHYKGGSISMSISPTSSFSYKYYYYLKVYDSNNDEVISQLYSGTSSAYSKTYSVSQYQLSPGNYTMNIINYEDNNVMDSANLTVKSYPTYSDYSVNVNDTTINYVSGGFIPMNISPAMNCTYKYYYYLRVYDSNNYEVISQLYYGENPEYSKTYNVNSTKLIPGNYTIRIINCEERKLMDTAKLTVESNLSYSDYSVSVSDINIEYVSGGSIYMNISPSSSSYYKYNFYLKVYDSNNNEVISQLYYDTSSAYSKTYSISEYQLSPGYYTIKIINYDDNNVMNTAKLNVKYTYPFYSDYSVSVSDNNIIYENGGFISMKISPSSNTTYKYYYYLKVYDSKNNVKLSQLYYNTISDYSISYNINSNQLSPGTYTVKIINYYDDEVMDTAKLSIKYCDYPFYSDYSVSVQAFHGDYGSKGLIIMPISPAYDRTYSHYFYLKVYNSNNDEVISQLYYDTEIWHSQAYDVSPYQLSPGTYTVKIINYYDNKVMDTTNFVVNKIPTKMIAYSITTSYNDNKCLIATLEDGEGNPINGKTLSITFNGDIKLFTTDANGQVKISAMGLTPKTYAATITFDGNSIYEKSTVTVKVTVKKATPKITAKIKTFKKSVKTKKYSITLKNNLNKVMENTKVTIKVNKKTYTAKTNSKGVATFKIKKLTKKGSFKSIVTYNGDKFYNKVTKIVKIKVK